MSSEKARLCESPRNWNNTFPLNEKFSARGQEAGYMQIFGEGEEIYMQIQDANEYKIRLVITDA